MTLTINHVDLDLLEYQRLQLASIIMDGLILNQLTAGQRDALTGITNMLDEWSDQHQYRLNNEEEEELDMKKPMVYFDPSAGAHRTALSTTARGHNPHELVVHPDHINMKIGDKVVFSDGKDFGDGYPGTLSDLTVGGKFVDDDDTVWDYCKPTQKRKVKSKRDLVKTLFEEGYLPLTESRFVWVSPSCSPPFHEEMFEHCGKEVPVDDWDWKDSWLE